MVAGAARNVRPWRGPQVFPACVMRAVQGKMAEQTERTQARRARASKGKATMDRRQALGFTGATLLAGIGLGLGGPALAQSEMVLKATDVHPFGYPTVEAVMWMGEELEKRTDGRLSVEMYPSMQLGGEKEMIEQAQVGAVAFARISVGPMGPLVPELNVFNLPFLFRDAAHMEAVIDGPIGDELLQKVTDHPTAGLVGLCWMNAGTRNVYNSQRPVRSIEDLEGLKIRMMGNPIFVDTMNAMGGNGVSMGFDQLINGLQTGVVDGAENNYPTYASGQHYRYAKYYSQTEHLMIPEILVFSKHIWEQLSEEDRDLIMSLAKEAQQRQRELWYAEEEKALAEMKANGVEVIEVEDKEAFREAVQPVWEKHAADLSELIERIQAVQ
jgi:tripartite ATP-independent transporter DctP family solute receptor